MLTFLISRGIFHKFFLPKEIKPLQDATILYECVNIKIEYCEYHLRCREIFVNPKVCLPIVHTNTYEISYLNLLHSQFRDISNDIYNISLILAHRKHFYD